MARSRRESHAAVGFPLRDATFTRGMSRTRIGEALCYLVSGVAKARREGADTLPGGLRGRGRSGTVGDDDDVRRFPRHPRTRNLRGGRLGDRTPLPPHCHLCFAQTAWEQQSSLGPYLMSAKVRVATEKMLSRSSNKSPVSIESNTV